MTIAARLQELADCLCAQVAEDGLPGLCFCGVVPGEAAAADYISDRCDDCGMAWVRLVSIYPTAGVGIADTTIGNCNKELGFDVEIGIMRCFSVGDAQGNPPSPNEVREAAALAALDAETMVRAVACCPAINSKSYVMGNYQPLGPQGGVVGGVWTLSLV